MLSSVLLLSLNSLTLMRVDTRRRKAVRKGALEEKVAARAVFTDFH